MKASSVIAWFFSAFTIAVIAGREIIDYFPMHLSTVLACCCFVLCLYVGALVGEKRGSFSNLGIGPQQLDKIIYWLGIGVGISTTLIWFFKLQKYGSIETFLANAYTIREGTIGRGDPSDLPIVIQYFNSLVYALFALALCRLGQTRKLAFTWWSIYFFALVVMNDLTQLGRIGILYAIFCVAGYFIVFRRRVFTLINITCVIALFGLLMLPRLIRGSFDNFEASVRNFRPYFATDVSPAFNALVVTYIYYFSSPYALDAYLQQPEIKHSYGERSLTPLVNIAARFTGDARATTIDEEAYVPFRYNIYTVLKDFYQDFGVFGISFLPFVIGFGLGRLFSSGAAYDSLKIYCVGWLFYTPIYNAFAFGGFLVSFVLLAVICGQRADERRYESRAVTA